MIKKIKKPIIIKKISKPTPTIKSTPLPKKEVKTKVEKKVNTKALLNPVLKGLKQKNITKTTTAKSLPKEKPTKKESTKSISKTKKTILKKVDEKPTQKKVKNKKEVLTKPSVNLLSEKEIKTNTEDVDYLTTLRHSFNVLDPIKYSTFTYYNYDYAHILSLRNKLLKRLPNNLPDNLFYKYLLKGEITTLNSLLGFLNAMKCINTDTFTIDPNLVPDTLEEEEAVQTSLFIKLYEELLTNS